jgi:hypothetical protein
MGNTENRIIETAILKGNSDKEAYQEAFQCTEANARGNASNYIKANPEIKSNCIKLLEKREGLSREKLLDVLERGINAKNPGKYGDRIEWSAQTENVKLLLRLYGELKEDSPTLIDNRQIHIDVSPQALNEWRTLLDRFDKMMSEDDVIDGEIVREKPQDTTDV